MGRYENKQKKNEWRGRGWRVRRNLFVMLRKLHLDPEFEARSGKSDEMIWTASTMPGSRHI